MKKHMFLLVVAALFLLPACGKESRTLLYYSGAPGVAHHIQCWDDNGHLIYDQVTRPWVHYSAAGKNVVGRILTVTATTCKVEPVEAM